MQTGIRSRAAAALVILTLLLAGCAKNLTPNHPNQINNFDGAAFDMLVTVQASLTKAKELAPQFPTARVHLNEAIASYNSAIAAYKLYHTSAAGAPDSATLQTQLGSLVGSVSKLLTELGVKLQ